MLRDAPGALEDFKAALKLSPYSAHMYFNRGNLYASTEQYDKAEKDYNKGNFFHCTVCDMVNSIWFGTWKSEF